MLMVAGDDEDRAVELGDAREKGGVARVAGQADVAGQHQIRRPVLRLGQLERCDLDVQVRPQVEGEHGARLCPHASCRPLGVVHGDHLTWPGYVRS
jgi:hypothetical protein